jgi:hypothetical protein
MSNLNSQLRRIERRLGEQPCAGCRMLKRVHVVRGKEQIDPAWSRCPLCGKQHHIKILIIPDATKDLAGGVVAVH